MKKMILSLFVAGLPALASSTLEFTRSGQSAVVSLDEPRIEFVVHSPGKKIYAMRISFSPSITPSELSHMKGNLITFRQVYGNGDLLISSRLDNEGQSIIFFPRRVTAEPVTMTISSVLSSFRRIPGIGPEHEMVLESLEYGDIDF